MKSSILVALRMTVVTLVLTGLVYPLVTTGLAQALFRERANGSLITDGKGHVVGSELIGQAFAAPYYFWSRPSSAGEKGYDATASSGSNLGTTSKKLRDRVAADSARLHKENPGAMGAVPNDLLAASGSGLDPHISPEAARWQIPRVARARGVAGERVALLVDAAVEPRELGILGDARVNVLLLNVALDRQFGAQR
ncbi:MAG: potassium-transporting ATPase chain [Myxococcales bacterium]|nr:potassium-transporting ATPase chain [Myxococcales bacterium]